MPRAVHILARACALGTYGAAARAKGVKARIETRDQKFGDAGERSRRPG